MSTSKSILATSILLAVALHWCVATVSSVLIGLIGTSSASRHHMLAMGGLGPLIAAAGIYMHGRRRAG